jgi:hypothetical protein
MRNAYKILVGKPEGKRPCGRPRCRCKHYIRIDLREIGLEGVDLMPLTQDRDHWQAPVSMVMSIWIPQRWEIS